MPRDQPSQRVDRTHSRMEIARNDLEYIEQVQEPTKAVSAVVDVSVPSVSVGNASFDAQHL